MPTDVSVDKLLVFVPPEKKEGRTCAVIPKSVTSLNTIKWNCSLIGYVVGATPDTKGNGFHDYLRWIWKLKGTLQIMPRGNGFFMFKFSSEVEMQRVLENGPWFVHGKPLVLKRWSPDTPFEHQRLTSIPIWVRFPQLPLKYWSKGAMEIIASTLGQPLFLDEATAKSRHFEFARLCVEINHDFEFPDVVPIFSEDTNSIEEVMVTYDWKPTPCTHCKTFGHLPSACATAAVVKGKQHIKPKEVWTVVKHKSNHTSTIPPATPTPPVLPIVLAPTASDDHEENLEKELEDGELQMEKDPLTIEEYPMEDHDHGTSDDQLEESIGHHNNARRDKGGVLGEDFLKAIAELDEDDTSSEEDQDDEEHHVHASLEEHEVEEAFSHLDEEEQPMVIPPPKPPKAPKTLHLTRGSTNEDGLLLDQVASPTKKQHLEVKRLGMTARTRKKEQRTGEQKEAKRKALAGGSTTSATPPSSP